MNWTLSIVSKLKDVQKYTHEERLIAWTRVTEIWHFILADCILERRGRLLAIVLVLVFVFDPQPAGEEESATSPGSFDTTPYAAYCASTLEGCEDACSIVCEHLLVQ
jgi:hypothetical protein